MAKLPKSGDFWEEIIYNFVKQKYQLEDQQIACGLEFKPLDGKKEAMKMATNSILSFLKMISSILLSVKHSMAKEMNKKIPRQNNDLPRYL